MDMASNGISWSDDLGVDATSQRRFVLLQDVPARPSSGGADAERGVFEETRWRDPGATEAASPGAQLLLREFAHRAGSEWSSALGEVSLAAARCGNEVARLALTNVEIRLRSYARVQNALRIPEHSARMDAYAYLGKICQAISHARLESRGIELTVSGHPFSMSSERCCLLGMIVSELVTNAARHAGTRGSASIRME